jgi:putative copper export protein/mono/diheme cytochrome c family protein
MVPPFDLQGGATLTIARGLTVAALLSAFGTTLFDVAVARRASRLMPPPLADFSAARLRLIVQASAACAIAALGLWLIRQAAAMADAGAVSTALAAVPSVLWKTSFGHVVMLQFGALAVLAVIAFWPRAPWPWAALAAASVALCLHAGHSHAFSMRQGPSLLLACDVLHLLGAGAWLGGLVPLLVIVWTSPPKIAASAARWFSPVGQASIAALLVSAVVQGWVLVGGAPGLLGTAYGWMVLVKLALFGVLLGFAWFNRYRFAPALLRSEPVGAARRLTRSILLQTLVALSIIAAAIVLSGLPPAMHLQALWPFPERFSLAAMQEDPDIAREVFQAGSALVAAFALLFLALAVRRLRLAACAVVLVVAWFALPHFDPLLVTAYPTSFYHSPTGFASSSIVQGGDLFAVQCTRCHGADGAGDGPLAKTLPVPPADLTAAHLWMHSDGELFWWISHGMETPEDVPVMPGFADTLDEDSRWALIDYIRAHNAGTAKIRTGAWPQLVKAPDFSVACGSNIRSLTDLRGQFLRIVIGGASATERDMVRVFMAPDAMPGAMPGMACVTQDRVVAQAYAILSGSAVDAMTGVQFIVDSDGWLRAMQPPTSPGSWNDPTMLMAEIKTLRARTVTSAMSTPAPMKMPM